MDDVPFSVKRAASTLSRQLSHAGVSLLCLSGRAPDEPRRRRKAFEHRHHSRARL